MEEKIFRDTRTQIGILKSRGLIIKNKRRAKQIIQKVNYYNLINGYKEPFLQSNIPYEKYLTGTRLEEVYALYEFDRKLRIITLEYILEIEKNVKAQVAYCFSKKHGHKNYLKMQNFEISGMRKYERVCDLLSNLYRKITLNINKDLSISHYVSGINYIPLWVLVNTMSMGDISKFYSNMMQSERDEVARRIKWGVREHQLASCLFFLSSIRNRCAHDERLYSYLSYVSLCDNRYFSYYHIHMNSNTYFSVMIALKLLLPKQRYFSFHRQIENLFDDLSQELSSISINKIRNAMGMPGNWRRLKTLE